MVIDSQTFESLSLRTLRRVVFISPHPDDVELCCGILMRRLVHSGIQVHYVCVTDGAPSKEAIAAARHLTIEWPPGQYDRMTYKLARRQETINALQILGVTKLQIEFLDYPDLETHAHIQSIVQDFGVILSNTDAVFCCPFEGGHPDHDICRFALAVATKLTHKSGSVFEYASHNHLGYNVFLSTSLTSFSVVANPDEEKIQQVVALTFTSQKEMARQFKTDIEYFRRGHSTFNLADYLSYEETPAYEQFAFPGSYVLKKIEEYLAKVGPLNPQESLVGESLKTPNAAHRKLDSATLDSH